MRQRHQIFHKPSGQKITFETEGPPKWGDGMPNPDMVTLGEVSQEPTPEEKPEVLFSFWYQLQPGVHSIIAIDNVVSYCIDVANHFALVVWKNDTAPNGLEGTFLNTDHLIGFGAVYAPDQASDTFGLLQKPNGIFFGAGEPV